MLRGYGEGWRQGIIARTCAGTAVTRGTMTDKTTESTDQPSAADYHPIEFGDRSFAVVAAVTLIVLALFF